MRARGWVSFGTVLMAMALVLGGCHGSRKKRIAVIPKGTSNLFWISVRSGALAAGQQFGVEILWNGPSQETEYARQIQIVDSMVAQQVDGMALAATERKALVAPLERAVAAGIPVTVFDSGVDSDKFMTFIATDNHGAGQTAARTLAALLGGKGKVAMVEHAPGSFSTMDRERGFEEVMKAEFPGIEIVARQFGQGDSAKSMDAAENIMTAHPDLNGIFASSEPSSIGTSQAIKSRGLSGKVKLVAFDSSQGLIADLKSGVIDALVVQDPYKMGFEAVRTVVEKLGGKTPPKQIDLTAQVVRAADLDKPETKRLLSPQ